MTKKKNPSELSYLSKLPENCALSDAVRHFGTKTALAKHLGLGRINKKNGQMEGDRQVVSEWFRRGSIPKKYVLPLHQATGIPLTALLADFTPYTPQTEKAREKAEPAKAASKVVRKKAAAPAPSPAKVEVPSALQKKPAKPKKTTA